MNGPTNELRWVRRDGELVLQQRWSWAQMHRERPSTPPDAPMQYGDWVETTEEWRDVPVAEEDA